VEKIMRHVDKNNSNAIDYTGKCGVVMVRICDGNYGERIVIGEAKVGDSI
jgi:hypothetical protein